MVVGLGVTGIAHVVMLVCVGLVCGVLCALVLGESLCGVRLATALALAVGPPNELIILTRSRTLLQFGLLVMIGGSPLGEPVPGVPPWTTYWSRAGTRAVWDWDVLVKVVDVASEGVECRQTGNVAVAVDT